MEIENADRICVTRGTAGLGYVNVVDPSTYDNLPAKLTGYDDDEYVATTAVTHQLHCLVSSSLSLYPH